MESPKKTFRKYRDALVHAVGRGPMDDTTLSQLGRIEFGKRWAGVHPADRTKKLLGLRDRFAIVNTGGSSSPGYHWMGFYITQRGVPYLYDTFGRNPNRLAHYLARAAADLGEELQGTDPKPEQRASDICGQLSLSWLLTVRDLGIRATAGEV